MTSIALPSDFYVVRQGVASDRDDVVHLVRSRAEFMRSRGQGRWATWDRLAGTLGDQVRDPEVPTWVMVNREGRLVGLTTASLVTPSLGWTEEERRESAVFLQSTVTDPAFAGQGLGILLAFWALDYAARQRQQWVRRGVLTVGRDNRGLIRYYRLQGWRVTRAVPHPSKEGVTVWSLQRPAEPQDELGHLVSADRYM